MDIKRMHESLECLSSWMLESCHNGPCNFDPCVAGQVSDIMKDLSMAMYYRCEQKMMEEMMEKQKESGMEGPYGYDHWHYASGKFAPTGHGHRVAGYPVHGSVRFYDHPDRMMPKEGHDDSVWMGGPMGYPMRGDRYEEYRNAKRHYTETKDETSKRHMYDMIEETVMDSMDIMREVMKDATPEMRKKMKEQMTKLSEELGKV